LTADAIITLITIGLLVAALLSNRIGPDTAMIGALTLLLGAGVVTVQEAAVGFADPSVLMIASLFVVARGLTETGAMEMIASRLLGRPKTQGAAQLRLMTPVAVMSAFMNNTPIVAMYMPIVGDWSRKLGISASKLYMPLSFAAILGGACTLIGTSTNLAVNGLYVTHYDALVAALDHPASPLHEEARRVIGEMGLTRPDTVKQFWWIAAVGLPVAFIGVPFIAIAARWLLPERTPPQYSAPGGREYTVETLVSARSPIAGKTIEQAGLRNLPGLYLVEIERDGDRLPAVGPEERIEANDRLVFAGEVDSVVDLLKTRGLDPATDEIRKVQARPRERTVVEAVVSAESPLVRQTVRASQFRTRYNAAIIAVHRGGQRVRKKIGDITLQPGDTLLLYTHAGFVSAHRNSPDFYLVSNVDGADDVRHERAWLALSILGLVVVMLALPTGPLMRWLGGMTGLNLPEGGVPPLVAGMIGAVLMVFTRCTTGTSARNNINWQVLLVIGAALGVGRAMEASGAAALIADATFGLILGLGPYAVLLAFGLVTTVLCQLVTNKGAAVLMFPIAVATANELGVSPEPFVVTLMVVAACSFMTPVGFVTNMMVLGPGGYRYTDYLRLGGPLTLIVLIAATLIAPAVFPFDPS